MIVREIIQEQVEPKFTGTSKPLPSRVTDPLPGAYVQKNLRNTDPYLQYRYGLAVAAARAIKNGELSPEAFQQETEWAENLTQIGFVPEDEETVALASKMMGITPRKITKTKSSETDAVNKTSPVAKKKKNKYGV